MNQLKLFIELTRLKKPIGFMLLFWPCARGLTLAYDFSKNLNNYIFYIILFFLGSVLMRSAGCIVNDISDKEFDKKVFRTKSRPIASGKISIKRSQPKATSKTIITIKPPINPSVATSAYLSSWVSGMTSSTTTKIMAPAAKANA